jgi:hypothetical protein
MALDSVAQWALAANKNVPSVICHKYLAASPGKPLDKARAKMQDIHHRLKSLHEYAARITSLQRGWILLSVQDDTQRDLAVMFEHIYLMMCGVWQPSIRAAGGSMEGLVVV